MYFSFPPTFFRFHDNLIAPLLLVIFRGVYPSSIHDGCPTTLVRRRESTDLRRFTRQSFSWTFEDNIVTTFCQVDVYDMTVVCCKRGHLTPSLLRPPCVLFRLRPSPSSCSQPHPLEKKTTATPSGFVSGGCLCIGCSAFTVLQIFDMI